MLVFDFWCEIHFVKHNLNAGSWCWVSLSPHLLADCFLGRLHDDEDDIGVIVWWWWWCWRSSRLSPLVGWLVSWQPGSPCVTLPIAKYCISTQRRYNSLKSVCHKKGQQKKERHWKGYKKLLLDKEIICQTRKSKKYFFFNEVYHFTWKWDLE